MSNVYTFVMLKNRKTISQTFRNIEVKTKIDSVHTHTNTQRYSRSRSHMKRMFVGKGLFVFFLFLFFSYFSLFLHCSSVWSVCSAEKQPYDEKIKTERFSIVIGIVIRLKWDYPGYKRYTFIPSGMSNNVSLWLLFWVEKNFVNESVFFFLVPFLSGSCFGEISVRIFCICLGFCHWNFRRSTCELRKKKMKGQKTNGIWRNE